MLLGERRSAAPPSIIFITVVGEILGSGAERGVSSAPVNDGGDEESGEQGGGGLVVVEE